MAITERSRETAFKMFSDGESTERVARRIRQTVPSTRALKANWTRSQSASSSTRSNSSRSTSSSRRTGFTDPVVVRLRSKRILEAVKAGRQIQLLIDVK